MHVHFASDKLYFGGKFLQPMRVISFFSRKLLNPQNTTDKATAKEVN